MRILFMGTPEFSVPCLEALLQAGHTLCGAVTQPDKPKGRGHKMMPPAVKEAALGHQIEVFQPQTLRDDGFMEVLKQLEPDIIVVVAYGKLLPKEILEYPRYGCVNVHASLLPKYRGAGPIQWCVINGETQTGVTTMYMAEGLDTGDMILKQATPIGEEETAGELHDRLSVMGAELLIETVSQIEAGVAQREPQRDEESCYAPMISKETGKIDWTRPAADILNLIRGTNPWPAAHTVYQGEPLKVIRAGKGGWTSAPPGSLLGIRDKKLEVACGDGQTILMEEVQFQGSKRMTVESYLNGHTIDFNETLSEEME